MKISDVVEFQSNSLLFGDGDYVSPGIIIKKMSDKRYTAAYRYTVLWADKKMTTEHSCYLRLVKEDHNR